MNFEVNNYIWDGSHIMKVLRVVEEGGRKVLVGRWVTKTGKLYRNGYAYMVIDVNVIHVTKSLHEMEKYLNEHTSACDGYEVEDESDEDTFVYNVKKTIYVGEDKVVKDLGIFGTEQKARANAEKAYYCALRGDNVKESECSTVGNKYRVVCEDKDVVFDIIKKKLK